MLGGSSEPTSDSTIATTKWLVGGTSATRGVWVHESNNGDADVFDVSVLRQAMTELRVTEGNIQRVYVHDATSRVKFDVEFEKVTHLIAIGQDSYVAELQGLGSVLEVDKQFVRRAIESRGPWNPVRVTVHTDTETMTPKAMTAWYVRSVNVTRDYNPRSWEQPKGYYDKLPNSAPVQSGAGNNLYIVPTPVDWKWTADWKTT